MLAVTTTCSCGSRRVEGLLLPGKECRSIGYLISQYAPEAAVLVKMPRDSRHFTPHGISHTLHT
eukprot:gene12107-8331_t